MSRYLGFLFALVLLPSLPLDRADSDIAPNPMTGGWPVSPYEDGTTDVRMVEEDVVVRIYADSIVTVGCFTMHNEGETASMEVGFPFPDPNDLIRFRAFVDGRPVDVRDGRKDHSDPKSRESWTVYWKLWDTTFRRGQTCAIRVEYKTKTMQPSWASFFEREEHASLPADVLDTLRQATTIGNVEYTLETGKSWKGVLDRCRVSFELVGMSDAHIQKYWPEDGTTTENGVIWEYTDYEPSRRVTLTYCPYMPMQEMPEVLRGILKRFPDDAPLAREVGRFASYLGRDDLLRDIYHSFLARWNEPIPQLMEYAPGGRCRFDYQAGNDFYTVWWMASMLFREYRDIGELERGRDIAPTMSRISGAIVDSLATCGGLPSDNEFLFGKAKELLNLSNELIEARE